ncbi:meiosis inhibitor protein 1-like [Oncorhynchus kisutch]|uniref:meiosis inhibitor protein 1-like n=1 Tax=Oncorhynchus kisutch TaxID=8019 RepID=UPI0012DD962D|nr:meiosis inhibitor protein 1-like [Oncorhynchus kisutch]
MCRDIVSPAPRAQVLQHFFSILSYRFSLLPSLMPLFAAKLGEKKRKLTETLNVVRCGFLQRLSVSLLSQPDPAASILPQDCEEIEAVLRSSLPSLCCCVCEWPSLLCESPGPQCDPAGPRATQYCLLTLLHLALQHGDRLLPDSTVFSCVVTLLCSVQEQGDSALPPCVLRSALYLLSVTQDKSTDLDWAPVNCISKALSSSPSFASLYTHHPPLLHFLFLYPELAEHFGPRVLELWLSHRAEATLQSDTNSKKTEGPSEQNQDPDNTALLTLLKKSPTVILNLLLRELDPVYCPETWHKPVSLPIPALCMNPCFSVSVGHGVYQGGSPGRTCCRGAGEFPAGL